MVSMLKIWCGAVVAAGFSGAVLAQAETGPMGAGTEGRSWLPAGQSPVAPMPAALHQSVELGLDKNPFIKDARTPVRGIPVPRRGDPDYAEGNPHYTGEIPNSPLTLPARVFVPDGKLDPMAPCILVLNGYGIVSGAIEGNLITPYVEHGYTGITATFRQAPSDPPEYQVGVNTFHRFWGQDGIVMLNWIVQHFGCGMTKGDPDTAKVGMVGASALGASQWAVINQPNFPAALKAIAPDVAAGTYATFWYPGGMLPGPARIVRPGTEFGAIYPEHRDFDDFWMERELTGGRLSGAASRRVAVMLSGGWDDYITPGALQNFVDFRALSGPTNKKLLVGPWGHASPSEVYTPSAIAWMDYWLKGVRNGATDQPVTIYVQGVNRWRVEKAWPIPDATKATLYLGGQKSGTISSRNDGSLVGGSPAGGTANYTYDPDLGPFLKVMTSPGPVTPPDTRRLKANQAPDEAKVVTWTTAPLTVPTEVTGNMILSFWASSATDDADFVVDVSDVAPSGVSTSVVQGYLNGPRNAYALPDPKVAPPVPLVPGKPTKFTMRILPSSYVFPAGHRIRLTIAGGTDIGIAADGKPQASPAGPGKNLHAFAVTIYHDPAHPSALELPVIGSGWRQWGTKPKS